MFNVHRTCDSCRMPAGGQLWYRRSFYQVTVCDSRVSHCYQRSWNFILTSSISCMHWLIMSPVPIYFFIFFYFFIATQKYYLQYEYVLTMRYLHYLQCDSHNTILTRASIHLYSWMERGAVRVKCLAQEHNTTLDLESNALTIRPPHLPWCTTLIKLRVCSVLILTSRYRNIIF